jgi:hypothetical protein
MVIKVGELETVMRSDVSDSRAIGSTSNVSEICTDLRI